MAISLDEIINFLTINERIGTCGQPTAEQLALIREAGYEAVINLALPSSNHVLPNEGALVASLGMAYVHIPVAWSAPGLPDFVHFAGIMQTFVESKVFVHCALNMRVSCFICLYRVAVLGEPQEQAVHDMHRIWQPDETWQAFMAAVLKQVQ